MNYIWRVGWREFAENARTKGFWIGILLFPVLVVVGATVPALLASKGVSTRHFVLVDQEGSFGGRIRDELASRRQGELEEAVLAFARSAEGKARLGPFMTNGASGPALDLAQWRRAIASNAPAMANFRPPRPAWLEVQLPPGVDPSSDAAELEAALRPWLRGERTLPSSSASDRPKLFAAVVIPRGLAGTNVPPATIRYWSDNLADTDLREAIQRIVTEDLRGREYRALGVDPAMIARVESRRAPVTSLDPRKAEGDEQVGTRDKLRQWAPSFFVYLLWVSIFAVSQMLLNSVIEEKSNRIIEVLLSSITPHELMLGKLMGVMMTGGVMMLAWVGSMLGVGALVAMLASGGTEAAAGVGSIAADVTGLLTSGGLLVAFAAYFVLGYVAYATLFLTIGSMCNTLKDAQNLMGPVMVVVMVPLFLMPFIPRDPNGPIATVASWIPIYTPFVMMNRIAASPPWLDVLGTGVLLVVFDGFLLWACGRVFRLAILRSGQPPRIRELLRWVQGR